MSKKRAMNETITVQDAIVIDAQEDGKPQVEHENSDYKSLLEAVQEIRKCNDVAGFILRSDLQATVDLNDPSKIIEYAMLSSQTFDAAETLAATFRLGGTENILVEGKNLKMLCLRLGQNKISIFMEKRIDHKQILSALAPQPE